MNSSKSTPCNFFDAVSYAVPQKQRKAVILTPVKDAK